MANTYDWLFWVGGAVLGIAGLILLGWSLFADRSKGRKRCPKCWYDMTHSPGLTCSECGKTHKKENKLLKTRRRWRITLASIFILLCGVSLFEWPVLRDDGALGVVPTTVLISMMPDLQTEHTDAYAELEKRIYSHSLWQWQYSMLLTNCGWKDRDDSGISIDMKQQWPKDVLLAGRLTVQWPKLNQDWFTNASKRMYVVHKGDSYDCEVSYLAGGWNTASWSFAHFRELPDGVTGQIDLEVVVEVKLSVPQAITSFSPTGIATTKNTAPIVNIPDKWVAVTRKHISMNVDITGTVDDYLTPIRNQDLSDRLCDGAQFKIRNGNLEITRIFKGPADYATAAPVSIQLLRDGKPVAARYEWWLLTAHRTVLSYHGIKSEREDAFAELSPTDGYNWSIKVVGDAAVMMYVDGNDQYWAGEFEKPLFWDEQNHYWTTESKSLP